MSARIFVDTHVLVYARDGSERRRQPLAGAWLEALWRTRAGRLSMQVLQEYHVTVTQKLKPGMSQEAARADVLALSAWRPEAADVALLESAWRLQDHYRLSWWDSLIAASAVRTGCTHLLSEDLQDGQDLDGVTVVDPFTNVPESLLPDPG